MATAGCWSELQGVQLHPTILQVLNDDFGFPTMTPVQASAIPPLLSCKDVCVEAETGSGKTLSFLIPIAQMILFGRKPRSSILPEATKRRTEVRAIVLLPTRELAMQVHAVAQRLFSGLPGDVKPVPLIGGSANADDGGAGPDSKFSADHRVVIATPGRLGAAVIGGFLQVTNSFEVLVMDEADRLLDMGFAVTVTDILTRLPKQRRTGMYSATQTREVESLARAGMRNPVRVVVRVHRAGGSSNPANDDDIGGVDGGDVVRRARIPVSVQCFYRMVSPRDRLAALMQLLVEHKEAKVMVYTLTCACVEYLRRLPLERLLNETERKMSGSDSGNGNNGTTRKRNFFSLHGKMTQNRREKSLSQFSGSEAGVLLCTDVAARGIDIADVDWVVQLDVPQDPDAYIHRVGRTGRLGRDGRAMLFLGEWESSYADFLRVRKCGVKEWTMSGQAKISENQVLELVQEERQKATLDDRAVLEASEKAFLSFVRAYKEHRCSVLLKINEVDFNSVADSFGLLRLPRFHEFKRVRGNIEKRNSTGICIRDIKFKDKKRETKRQKDIGEAIANRGERREALQAKSKKKKKKKRKRGQQNDGPDDHNDEDAGKHDMDDDDDDDFSMEAMQLRKLKRGKLTQAQFDQAAGYDKI